MNIGVEDVEEPPAVNELEGREKRSTTMIQSPTRTLPRVIRIE
jgi:hypothetical protein